MNKPTPTDKTSLLFQKIKRLSNDHPVQTLSLGEISSRMEGLIIIRNTCSKPTLENLLHKIIAALPDGPDRPLPPAPPASAREICKEILGEQLIRIQTSGLPCSFLLMEFKDVTFKVESDDFAPEEILGTLREQLLDDHLLLPYSSVVLAIILPNSGLGRSLRRARDLRKSLLSNRENLPGHLCIGLATARPQDSFTPDTLMSLVEGELEKSQTSADNISHAGAIRTEHSCQVTVEERTHLFQCFT